MAALVAISAVRLGRVSAMGRAAGRGSVGGGARKAGGGSPLRSIARQARRSAASSGHLFVVVEVEGVESLADGATVRLSGAGGRAVACAAPSTIDSIRPTSEAASRE
jgi:hypothetical protein